MLIFGFDCAIKNLGICCVEFDEKFPQKIMICMQKLFSIYKNIDAITKDELKNTLKSIYEDLKKIIDNIITIVWCNVIDLTPGKNVKNNITDHSKKIKYVLSLLDANLSVPDYVLIEHQMKANDITRLMSSAISYHYSPVEKTDLCLGVKQYPLPNPVDVKGNTIVKVIGASLKNSIAFCKEGDYSNFILKTTNYTANKKHTTFNFEYFLKIFGIHIDNTKKMNDIADAFMMIIGFITTEKQMLPNQTFSLSGGQ